MPARFPAPLLDSHRFAAGLAHAARGPMTALLTYLELTEGAGDAAGSAERAIAALDDAFEAATGPGAPALPVTPEALAAWGVALLAPCLGALRASFPAPETIPGLKSLLALARQLEVLAGRPGTREEALGWLADLAARRHGVLTQEAPGRWRLTGLPADAPPSAALLFGPGEAIAPSWSFPFAAAERLAGALGGRFAPAGGAWELELPARPGRP